MDCKDLFGLPNFKTRPMFLRTLGLGVRRSLDPNDDSKDLFAEITCKVPIGELSYYLPDLDFKLVGKTIFQW